MRPQIALGVVILALATLVISEHINLTAPVNWTLGTTPVHELHKRHEPADQELWDKHVAKGERLLCLMEVSDNYAGRMLQDTRNPPSAASIWTGTLDGASW
ncbi:cytochrome p450 [Pyrenophora seminiperda CCB06]|uniref:Cytochrome p450 n=1 Tax=Pyrenophora seminiperda CCB06 TaxID=1302712 RepID=A0A3M7M421_9PLEO|nr:cytochrome p450 [Pyrenophora seminiperda CCB06]